MGVNCSNCAGTCQKGDKNEINAEISVIDIFKSRIIWYLTSTKREP